ncbi:hypothetical protein B0H15DRAFT_957417 [Mycena belliarum]|uniref:Uncharacterized protein n=1 Tax=Mycena belliarum TaxID=1033014 RepID=A0AAD6TPD6_9AGAR|nr:hypothetical protein B0H15DRAFT_957417 [Mycena belliae]
MRALPFPQSAFTHGKPFHHLTSLSLVLPPGCDVVWPLSIFTDAPRLQVLDICAEETPMSSLISIMPWSQLTHIKLELPMDFAHACDILSQCKSVVQCHLGELIKDDENFVPPQHMCQLDHLVEFTLAALIVSGAFFDGFTFPGLLHLTVHSHGPILNTLLNLHHRSQFSLTHLTLIYVPFAGEELINFLCHLPTLQVLELQSCRVDAVLLAAFTYSSEAGAPPLFLPLLRSLELVTQFQSDGLLLAAMVESMSRYCGGQNLAFPALVEVNLYLHLAQFDDEVEDRLAAACASGMVVNHMQHKHVTMHTGTESLLDDRFMDWVI